MKDESFSRIMLVAVIILALGEGYLMYGMSQLQRPSFAPSATQVPSGLTPPPPSTASGQMPVAPISPSSILSPVSGIVLSVNGSRLVLSNGSTTATVLIDSSTTIVTQGELKDSAQYNAEMEAFRQSSMALSQDPKKNMSALETLIAPSHYRESSAHASDIVVGVYVTTFSFIQGGELHTNKIIISLPIKR